MILISSTFSHEQIPAVQLEYCQLLLTKKLFLQMWPWKSCCIYWLLNLVFELYIWL